MDSQYHLYNALIKAKKERDLHAELASTKHRLQLELTKEGFLVTDHLHFDGERHTQQKGQPDEWWYLTWYQKDESDNPSLICSVGFNQFDDAETIRVPVYKIKRNEK